MSFFSYLADRLILVPTTHPIEAEGKNRIEIETSQGFVEIWEEHFHEPVSSQSPKLIILKFPGAAGRAERAGVHPAEVLPQFNSRIWTINPHGYGGSTGPATIKSLPDVAKSVYSCVMEKFGENVPRLVVGNSLGCLSALYLAANFPTSALILRNPPPIHQLIRTRPRYASWNFGLSKWIADEVPKVLDAVANASVASAPCLFIQSEKDRVVPVKYQNMIIDAYAGAKNVFLIPGADHHEHVNESDQSDYFAAIQWLQVQFEGR